eukprot:5876054-Pleurochrysis_carterae.AAC.1
MASARCVLLVAAMAAMATGQPHRGGRNQQFGGAAQRMQSEGKPEQYNRNLQQMQFAQGKMQHAEERSQGVPAPGAMNGMESKPGKVCWHLRSGYNAVRGLIPSPRSEKRNDTFYFGEKGDEVACKQACEVEPACKAFTWMGKGKGGWLGGNSKWALQCYGRGSQSMTMAPDKDKYSGVKVSCEELEEVERSFGADPSRLQRSASASREREAPKQAAQTTSAKAAAGHPSSATGASGTQEGPGRRTPESADSMSQKDMVDYFFGENGAVKQRQRLRAQGMSEEEIMRHVAAPNGKPARELSQAEKRILFGDDQASATAGRGA